MGRDRESRDKEDAQPPIELKTGIQVQVHGLQKNPEKNGAIGTLMDFNKDKGRWQVEFANGSVNNFKPENLEPVSEAPPEEDDNDEEIPTAKVYIANLAAETDAKELQDLFGKIGVIAKEPVRDSRGTKLGFERDWPFAVKLYKPGRKGGDACIEYQDKFAARAAIRAYNGYKLRGSKLTVQYAGTGKKYEKRELTPSWVERNADRQDRSRSRGR